MKRHAYQELAKGTDHTVQHSNIVHDALKAGIPMPQLLTKQQCLNSIEACSRKLSTLRSQAGGLHQVHLRDCLIHAKSSGDEDKCKGILQTITRKEQILIWQQINSAIDEPSLGAVLFVQSMEHGEVVDIYKTKAMNLQIQVTTEQRFDLSMSAPITMTSLWDQLGFLSDTEFATQMLCGEVHIPLDINATTTLVLEEIIHLFNMLHKGHTEITLGGKEFQYYWQ
jgi:hypothetical protein